MAKALKKIFDPSVDEVVQGYTVESWHVSQSVDAFTGTDAYDITLSGSLIVTGSIAINGLSNIPQNSVLLYDNATGLVYYTASSAFAVNNFYTSSVTQSITSSVVNNNFTTSTINQTIISSSVNNPAPSNNYVQFNSASAFGASADFQFIYTSSSLQQGNVVIAPGIYSHAEGKGTISIGNNSHAEGQETISIGISSHAEGYQTSASAQLSHAEGNRTVTNAPYSHAEGSQTQTAGTGSHAEGDTCTTVGNFSHAEGFQTFAQGNYSHAEGGVTTARVAGAHSEGYYTYASGLYSHTEGENTLTIGNYSHAEGSGTIASGSFSHAEGDTSIALGDYSHAEGESTVAYGPVSHAEGLHTIASGSGQLAAGKYNTHNNLDSLVVIGNGVDDANRSDLALFNSQSITFNQPVTGSIFTGSFVGDGSGLTGISASYLASSASNGTGISTFTYNGTSNVTVEVSGASALSSNTLTKWTGDAFANTSITDDGTLVTFSTDALFQGDITVQGTASFQNAENLLVADRFVLFASGSNATGDGGIVVQQGTQNIGELYGYDSGVQRWGFTGSFNATSTSYAPEAYIAAVVDVDGGQSDIAKYQKNGNIRVSGSDIYIYA